MIDEFTHVPQGPRSVRASVHERLATLEDFGCRSEALIVEGLLSRSSRGRQVRSCASSRTRPPSFVAALLPNLVREMLAAFAVAMAEERRGDMSQMPESFQSIRDLFVIHTYEMLKLDKKPPIYGVALLVAVACEVLAKVLPGAEDAEEIFAREFAPSAPRHVGRDMYDVLRNGLAHSYGPNPILVGKASVQLALTWKRGPHLRVVGLRRKDGHNTIVPVERNERESRFVCLDAESLHRDLVALFDRMAQRLSVDATLARAVDEKARHLQSGERELKRPEREARRQWEDFLSSAALHEDDAGRKV